MKQKSYKLFINIVFLISLLITIFNGNKVIGAPTVSPELKKITINSNYNYYNVTSCGNNYDRQLVLGSDGKTNVYGCVPVAGNSGTSTPNMVCSSGTKARTSTTTNSYVWICRASKSQQSATPVDTSNRKTTFDNDYLYYNATSCGTGYVREEIKSTKGDATIYGCITTNVTDDGTAISTMKCPQGYPRKQGGGGGPVWVCAASKAGNDTPPDTSGLNYFTAKVSSGAYDTFVNATSCTESVKTAIRVENSSNGDAKDIIGCMYDAAENASSLVTCPSNSSVQVVSITNKAGDTFNAAMCTSNSSSTNPGSSTTPGSDKDDSGNDTQLGSDGGSAYVPIEPPDPGLDYNNLCNNNGFKQASQLAGYLIKVAKWLVPLLIIAFGIADFTKAVMSSDEQAINKATGSLIKRLVAGLAVFFAPTLLFVILDRIEATKMEGTGLTIEETNTFVTCTRCLQYPSDCIITNDVKSKYGERYVATIKRDTNILGDPGIICSIGDDYINTTKIEVTLNGDTTIQATACLYKRDRSTDYQVTCASGKPLNLVVADTQNNSELVDAYVCEGDKTVDENPDSVG